MIKFFRKIRRKLAYDNNMGKYLRYATGEILLVIIGILLALQINNSYEERIEKRTFQNNLQFVIEDLDQDKTDLLRLKNERQRVYNKANDILQAAKERTIISSREIYENSEIMLWKSFEINANGLERIQSSNLYESLKFEPLRKKIREYYIVYRQIKDLEKKLNESVEEMEVEMSKDGSILDLYEYSNLVSKKEGINDNLKNEIENYHIDFNKFIINNPPMLALFERGKLITNVIIQTYDKHIELGDDLKRDIRNYLNKK